MRGEWVAGRVSLRPPLTKHNSHQTTSHSQLTTHFLFPMNSRPFRPSAWLPGPHAQTLGARLIRATRRGVELRRERLTLPDGDFLDLDWAWRVKKAELSASSPLVLVVHGLEGSARSGYSRELYRTLAAKGIASVGMNFRSCSGELNRRPRMYHSGETEDLSFVSTTILARFPDRPFGAVGVSLGGNALLKHLAEISEKPCAAIQAAVAISVPYDLAAGADDVERGFSRVYRWFLVHSLKRKIRGKAGLFRGLIDVEAALGSRTFREFDDTATAPLHGFTDAEDYYRRSSSARYLDRIRTPALLIHSRDDPFLPEDAIANDSSTSSACIEWRITARGGHVGFVEGPPWAPAFWAESQAAAFLAKMLKPSS